MGKLKQCCGNCSNGSRYLSVTQIFYFGAERVGLNSLPKNGIFCEVKNTSVKKVCRRWNRRADSGKGE